MVRMVMLVKIALIKGQAMKIVIKMMMGKMKGSAIFQSGPSTRRVVLLRCG